MTSNKFGIPKKENNLINMHVLSRWALLHVFIGTLHLCQVSLETMINLALSTALACKIHSKHLVWPSRAKPYLSKYNSEVHTTTFLSYYYKLNRTNQSSTTGGKSKCLIMILSWWAYRKIIFIFAYLWIVKPSVLAHQFSLICIANFKLSIRLEFAVM